MDKKQEILDVTYDLFSEKGYSLSMSEISQAVNIKTPSLYSHFKNKDEIIEVTIKKEIERCFNTIYKKESELANSSCEENLKSLFFLAVKYYKDNRRMRFWCHISLLQHEHLKNISRLLIENRNSYVASSVRSCFKKGIEDKEIREDITDGAIYLYLSMIQGFLEVAQFNLSNDAIEDQATMVWDAYWNGIKFQG